MARPVSSLESHPQRQKIIDAIAAGIPYRDISSWTQPPVTPMALSRYKRSAVDTLIRNVTSAKAAIANNDSDLTVVNNEAVTRAALSVASDPFLLAAQKQSDRRGRWIREIEDAGDYTDSGPDYATLAKLDRNDLTALELHARLAGRLDARPTGGDSVELHLHLGIPRLDPGRNPIDTTCEALPEPSE